MNRAERRRQRKLGGSQPGPSSPALHRAVEEAIRLHQSGQLLEAEKAYRHVLDLAPGHPDALHLIGVARLQGGDPSTAERYIREALQINGKNPAYHRSLGKVLLSTRQHDAAIACFNAALELDPQYIDAHNDLGTTFWDLSRTEEALTCFRRVLEIDPGDISANNNLGLALRDGGDIDGAISRFRKAAQSDPNSVEVQNNLGLMLQEQGEQAAALAAFRTAIRLAPQQTTSWITFAEALRFARIDSADPDLEQDIVDCFAQEGVNKQRLAVSSIGLLRLDPEFSKTLRELSVEGVEPNEVLTPHHVDVLSHRLLIALLWRAIIPDFEFERLLTNARRAMLQACLSRTLPSGIENFANALSANCFTNEYVFAVSDAEERSVASLVERLPVDLDKFDEETRVSWAIVGCYAALHSLPELAGLNNTAAESLEGEFGDLVRRQLIEPRKEAELKQTIPSLSAINDSVSQKVREQYEENPYPRWVTVNAGRPRPLVSVVRQLFPHAPDLPIQGRQDSDILIAGCGTGQTAVQASYRLTNPNILAVDLSRASLAFAKRRAQELGVDTVEFVQGDILELGTCGRTFDFIEAAGVLHHMADPRAGWQVLRGLLRPGGFMKVALYSEYARRNVAAARAFVAEGGYDSSAAGIRRCRQDIYGLPQEEGARQVSGSLDFHAVSPCRDLIFHVQEQVYTLPEIADLIESLGLRFIGFELRDRSIQNVYRERFPNDDSLSNLGNWHEFEAANPDTFAGMYQIWTRDIST